MAEQPKRVDETALFKRLEGSLLRRGGDKDPTALARRIARAKKPRR